MASILKVDTIKGVATAGSIAVTGEGNSTTTNLQQGLAKAWFQDETLANNATTTAEDSFNISGYTDTATGQLTPAFSSNFSNTGYSSIAVNGTSSATNSLTKYNASTSGETILMYHVSTPGYNDVGICAVYKGDLA
tara:strand:- start:380 stop:787 length:408 start_codon:yes stop_codon:yes gene_type:complete